MAIMDCRYKLSHIQSYLLIWKTIPILTQFLSQRPTRQVVHHQIKALIVWVINYLMKFDHIFVNHCLEDIHFLGLKFLCLFEFIPVNDLDSILFIVLVLG